ncbi:MAG: hypothetical protein LBK83_02345 [Treponema sp.]|jgi:hypothetical protein|nr:hypothetical protein [Treponema sp.]
MGLDMNDKKKVCAQIARRYQQADKTGRGKLLDEYTETLGYNRDYLAHILSNWGTTRYIRVEGKTVKLIATPVPQRGRKGLKTASTGRTQGRTPQYQGSSLQGASGRHLGLVRPLVREAPGPYAPPHAGLSDRRIFPDP